MGWTGSGVDVDGTVELDGHAGGAALLFDESFLFKLKAEQLCFCHSALVIGVVHTSQVRQEVQDPVGIAVHLPLDILE